MLLTLKDTNIYNILVLRPADAPDDDALEDESLKIDTISQNRLNVIKNNKIWL